MQIQGMGQMMPFFGAGSMKPPDAIEMSGKILEEKDSDGDGVLSIGELGISEDRFSAADTDGDGFLSQDELIADISKMMESAPPPLMTMSDQTPNVSKIYENILNEKDTDEDGALSASELNISEAQLAKFDTNEDGLISEDEFTAKIAGEREVMPPPPPPAMMDDQTSDSDGIAEKILNNKDSDEDGQLSTEETGLSEETTSEIDTNGDGYISQAELTAWITKIMESKNDMFSLMA